MSSIGEYKSHFNQYFPDTGSFGFRDRGYLGGVLSWDRAKCLTLIDILSFAAT